ncbi:MAG: vWA domain-containing protein [Pirellulaceae bacterium]
MPLAPILFADIINSLPLWGWGLLALIPPAILALYFLKLKRQPLAVPSTYLWSRTIEDLHVNSLWQRLRQSLLLLLQLLLIVLLAITLLRPGWKGTELIGHRFIFLIDKSASMGASDVGPTRLDEAKKQVKGLIEQMQTGDQAMIISFSNRATPDQSYTGDRKLLRTKVDMISQTNHTTDLNEALRAASGLANPGQSGDPSKGDVGFAEAMPATLYIFTDGKLASVKNFQVGNLEPVFQKIGSETCGNVAIVAFSTDHHPDKPEKVEAFARIENFGFKPATMEASLYINGTLADAQKVSLPARQFKVAKSAAGVEEILPQVPTIAGIKFELARTAELEKDGILRLEIKPLGTDVEDYLSADNKAYAVVSAPRPAKVLLATPGNDALMLALSTSESQKVATVTIVEPAKLADKDIKKQLQEGAYDLVIYDQCAPAAEKEMPACNTLFIGRVPPVAGWGTIMKEKVAGPILTDTDQVHPLTQLVKMSGNVAIAEATPLKGPPGMLVLLDFHVGPLYCIAPRGGFEDAVLGFEIYSTNKDGEHAANTDWMIQRSFPVFMMNAVRYLGGVKSGANAPTTRPGMPVTLRAEIPVKTLLVQAPRGDGFEVPRETQNTYVFGKTDDIGVYDVREGTGAKVSQKFVVNLFDEQECDIFPAYRLDIQHDVVEATLSKQSARQEIWKWLLLGAVGLLIFEWYIYNKRVYL